LRKDTDDNICIQEEGDVRRLEKISRELHNLNSSQNIIKVIKSRRMKMGRTCSTHGRS
jgi:hypothetical protein